MMTQIMTKITVHSPFVETDVSYLKSCLGRLKYVFPIIAAKKNTGRPRRRPPALVF
jgi:hypothetical protein